MMKFYKNYKNIRKCVLKDEKQKRMYLRKFETYFSKSGDEALTWYFPETISILKIPKFTKSFDHHFRFSPQKKTKIKLRNSINSNTNTPLPLAD